MKKLLIAMLVVVGLGAGVAAIAAQVQSGNNVQICHDGSC